MSLTDDLHINRGWWPVVCPLRGSLGQTQYTHIRHNGELATESALFLRDVAMPPHALLDRYFELHGDLEEDSMPSRLGTDFADEVIEDDVVPLIGSPTMTVLDDGILVTRQGIDAHAFLLRRRPRIAGHAADPVIR